MEDPEEFAGFEYAYLPYIFLGNMFTVVRMSLGDNDFGAVLYLGESKGMVFWFIWIFIAYLCFIIFMNFIITEACTIYEGVMENIDQSLLLERSVLINEAEEMSLKSSKLNKTFYPNYLVTR